MIDLVLGSGSDINSEVIVPIDENSDILADLTVDYYSPCENFRLVVVWIHPSM